MISKVSGYQGFSSYGDKPYPSLKPGRQVLSPNDVWEQTQRTRDDASMYENHQHYKTVYKVDVSNAVQPKDYQNHTHVKKGLQTQYQLQATGKSVLSYGSDRKDEVFDPNNDSSKLKTGVEHWKSNYNAGIKDPYSYSKALRPEWSYHLKPHQVDSKIGPTEYKTTFGEFGTKPTDKLNEYGNEIINKHEDPLKMGTTKSTFHIPNYTGFIPAARTVGKSLEHSAALNSRVDKSRATIVDNYHTKIPGYAGHQPKAPVNQRGFLREHCFSTVSSLKL
ncbi:hypothetical protein ABPG74_001045 [Tetrahymena malaccensis]